MADDLHAAITRAVETLASSEFTEHPDIETVAAAETVREALTPLNPGTRHEQPWEFIDAAKRQQFLVLFATTDAEAGTGMSAQKAAVDRFDAAVECLDAACPGWRDDGQHAIFGASATASDLRRRSPQER